MNFKFSPMRMLLIATPVLLIFAMYASTLAHGKVWDDWVMLGDFEAYRNPAFWSDVLRAPLPFSRNYFRPLVVLTFLLESFFHGRDLLSHLINILLHGVNSLLLMLVCLRLWPRAADGQAHAYRLPAAIGVATLFAVHQVMAEGVVWIVGRFDLMVTMFALLAILADVAIVAPARRVAVVCLMFFLALLCKEMAVTIPVLLLLLYAARSHQTGVAYLFSRERMGLYAALTLTLALYMAVRYASLGYLLTADEQMQYLNLGSSIQRLLLVGSAFGGYLNVMFMPGSISPLHYGTLPIALDSAKAWIGLGLMLAWLVASGALVRRPGTRFLGYCMIATFISLMPVLQILPAPMLLGNTIFADRAAILPLALLLVGLGQLATTLSVKRRLAYLAGASVVWALAMIPVVLVVIPLWKHDLTMWSYLVVENPECGFCHSNKAGYLLKTAPAQALVVADNALKLAVQPWHRSNAYMTKAAALSHLGRYEEAHDMTRLAEQSEMVPRARELHTLNRVKMLIQLKRFDEARQVLDQMQKSGTSAGPGLLVARGHLALKTGRPDLARIYYHNGTIGDREVERMALLKTTNDPGLWRRLGDSMSQAGDSEKAAQAYAEADRLARVVAQPLPAAAAEQIMP